MTRAAAALFLTTLVACADGHDDPLDGEHDGFATGKADGAIDPSSDEARAILALVNDSAIGMAELDDDVALNRRAAEAIVVHRDGPDGEVGTADDDAFDSLAELDAVPFVGGVALDRLLAYAIDHGYLAAATDPMLDVVFSPQPSEHSHTTRIIELIGQAQHTIDIAMYSLSDSRIYDALAAAVARGVEVRLLFDTASEDRKLGGTALQNSSSGRLERAGADVRWVNKIMHHKVMLIDGPRDAEAAADTAILVTGSGNWSNGAATRYDENTLFLQGQRELVLRMQREFELLWTHSRELTAVPGLTSRPSTLTIDDAMIGDDPGVEAFYTSANFSVSGDTFSTLGTNAVADQLVAAIEGATESIHIASGHLRLRAVAEALVRKASEHPEVEIRVYLDGQEYVAATTNTQQHAELDDCLAAAGHSASKLRACNDKGFLWGFDVDAAGVDVRYKFYAYRWDASYALQMHHKYMIIDGDELWTGSFNLSDNAEHNTFENMIHLSGPAFAGIVAAYEANFAAIWETGRADDLLGQLETQLAELPVGERPIVFAAMALGQAEIDALKATIRAACPLVNTDEFRTHAASHKFCR